MELTVHNGGHSAGKGWEGWAVAGGAGQRMRAYTVRALVWTVRDSERREKGPWTRVAVILESVLNQSMRLGQKVCFLRGVAAGGSVYSFGHLRRSPKC
jgi:hypothetical protein